ncbi:MAG TPA: oxygenase MpaB family protein [Solirubrobacteraceae bacterium]|nr:oxygenase MpaB family protein [Solirubrobacteraceae bacterium]
MAAFAHGYYDADPVAEAFVDEVYLGRGTNEGRRILDQAIAEGVEAVPDAPESMRLLFDEFELPPGWLDRDLVELGAALFRRYGPSVFSFAGVETLLGYTESSIVKPLAFTGAYAGDTALHRFMETARFWIDVSEPGGLDPGAAGRATAMRVRIMHVFLRRRLLSHPDWDLAAWGVPISQSDALITLMSSSLTPGLAMHLMGYRTTAREIEAMMHYWRYVGHLLGVQPRWYPETVQEGLQLSAVFLLKCAGTAGADGVELVESYPRAFTPKPGTGWRRRIRDEVNYRAQVGYTRYFLPGRFYRRYDMPNPWPWALHPLLQAPAILLVDSLRRHSATVARLQDRYARWRREAWWRHEMGERQSHFKAAEQLRR